MKNNYTKKIKFLSIIISIILISTIIGVIAYFNSSNVKAKKIMTEISQIGEPSISDESLLIKIDKDLKSFDDNDLKKIKNISSLIEAKKIVAQRLAVIKDINTSIDSVSVGDYKKAIAIEKNISKLSVEEKDRLPHLKDFNLILKETKKIKEQNIKLANKPVVTPKNLENKKFVSGQYVTVTIPGQHKSVYIPSRSKTVSIDGQFVTATIPGTTQPATMPGYTFSVYVPGKYVDITSKGEYVSVAYPGKSVSVSVPGGMKTVSVPGHYKQEKVWISPKTESYYIPSKTESYYIPAKTESYYKPGERQWVNGYFRSDGTYVSGYYRNMPGRWYTKTIPGKWATRTIPGKWATKTIPGYYKTESVYVPSKSSSVYISGKTVSVFFPGGSKRVYINFSK